jgi:hypothetical protein
MFSLAAPSKLIRTAWDYRVRERKALSSSPLGVMSPRLSLSGPTGTSYRFEPRPCGQANMGLDYPSASLLWKLSVADGTLLGALAFAGRVLPDATLRGMRMFRSHGGTVPTVSGWNLSSEASSPGSDAPCRERRAGRGADTPAISNTSRRHRCHGDGPGFWPDVGPALRV